MRARLAEPTCFERRRCARWRACVALVLYPAAIAAQPGGRPAAEAVAPVDAAHAFDFVLGLWKVEEQRSTRPLQGLTTGEVEIRQGVASWRPLAGGVGLIEESELEHPNAAPSRGVTLLAYALPARQWTLLEFSAAAGSRSVMGRGLCHGTPGRCAGEFIGSETIDGRVVLAREHIRMWALHAWEWERQISPDGGLHWETLRRRYYSRTGADSAAPPQPGATAVPRPARTTYCCSQMELRRYVASKDRVRVLEELFHDENAVGRSVGIQQRVSSGLGTDSADVDVYWMQNLALLRDVDRPDLVRVASRAHRHAGQSGAVLPHAHMVSPSGGGGARGHSLDGRTPPRDMDPPGGVPRWCADDERVGSARTARGHRVHGSRKQVDAARGLFHVVRDTAVDRDRRSTGGELSQRDWLALPAPQRAGLWPDLAVGRGGLRLVRTLQ
jgi:hypothetical protein